MSKLWGVLVGSELPSTATKVLADMREEGCAYAGVNLAGDPSDKRETPLLFRSKGAAQRLFEAITRRPALVVGFPMRTPRNDGAKHWRGPQVVKWGAQFGEEHFTGVWGTYTEAKAVLGDGDDFAISAIRVEDDFVAMASSDGAGDTIPVAPSDDVPVPASGVGATIIIVSAGPPGPGVATDGEPKAF